MTAGFDLPPRWDGQAVVWSGWESPPTPHFACGPVAAGEVCPACGSVAVPVMNRGRVARYAWIWAFRCPDCRSDTVWDPRSDEWWGLDPDDYTLAGADR